MSCEHCNGPGEDQKCCWAKAREIEKFKQHVLKKFIFEVLFDLIISVVSVITDIITIILYLYNGKWLFVILTAIPVILPTTVFTNIYLSDESRGYCKMPADRIKKLEKPKTVEPESNRKKCRRGAKARNSLKARSTGCLSHLTCGIKCTSARMCLGGLFQIFHKDSAIRKTGANAIRKSFRRSLKYFFGTFILRFIAWTWYFKALIHGFKAYRSPKKFMNIQPPDLHWSYELLVRLDFLQAALENAPQCVVQLYALITQPDEQITLGMLTLFFSFVDFVRVAMAVLWDIHKGPIIAPQGCYGTLTWRIVNSLSWITVYAARSCSLALVFATSEGWSIGVTIVGLSLHILIFSRLFSKNKYGVATEKVAVTTFITLFFLPELNATDVEKLTQFYYAMIMFQNVFFIIPWNGIEADYCIQSVPKVIINSKPQNGTAMSISSFSSLFANFVPYNTFDNDFERGNFEKDESCLIDPIVIVLMVPTCTIIGMVLRLAVATKMVEFIEQNPKQEYTMKMEERVADIYRKKWTNMSIKELTSAFAKMLKKEVIQSEPEDEKAKQVALVTNQFQLGFKTSQSFIRKSFSMILLNRPTMERGEQYRSSFTKIDENSSAKRKFSKHNNWSSFPTRKLKNDNFQNLEASSEALQYVTMKRNFKKPSIPFLTTNVAISSNEIDSEENETETEIIDVDTLSESSSTEIVPRSFFAPCIQRHYSTTSTNSSTDNLFPNLGVNVQTIQIDMPDGNTRILEMGWL